MITIGPLIVAEGAYLKSTVKFHSSEWHTRVISLVLLHMSFPAITLVDVFATLGAPVGVAKTFCFRGGFGKVVQGASVAYRASGGTEASADTVDRWS